MDDLKSRLWFTLSEAIAEFGIYQVLKEVEAVCDDLAEETGDLNLCLASGAVFRAADQVK